MTSRCSTAPAKSSTPASFKARWRGNSRTPPESRHQGKCRSNCGPIPSMPVGFNLAKPLTAHHLASCAVPRTLLGAALSWAVSEHHDEALLALALEPRMSYHGVRCTG